MSQTTQQVVDKWASRMTQATDAMKNGVMAVTEAPGAKAAAASDRWAAGVQRALQTGKFANRVGSVSLQQWQQAYISKGIQRVAAGVQQAKPVMQQFMDFWLPITQASSRAVAAMQQGPGEAARARMLANYDNLVGKTFQRR